MNFLNLVRGAYKYIIAYLTLFFVSTFSAFAQFDARTEDGVLTGQPEDWQLNLQPAVTPVKEAIHDFHWLLLAVIVSIVVFVLILLFWVSTRYHQKFNKNPSKTTHNVPLEIVWTVVPALILLGIAFPSFALLKQEKTIPEPDVVVKAIGYSWYWGYEYPDEDMITFDSLMLTDEELQPGQPRLLAVDNPVIVPVNKNILVQVTSADVLHSFAMPAFGIKSDAIPGRLNQTWFRAEREGVYYGQCSELCGKNHAFMPIEVRVVSQEEYDVWLVEAKQKWSASARTDKIYANTIEPNLLAENTNQ